MSITAIAAPRTAETAMHAPVFLIRSFLDGQIIFFHSDLIPRAHSFVPLIFPLLSMEASRPFGREADRQAVFLLFFALLIKCQIGPARHTDEKQPAITPTDNGRANSFTVGAPNMNRAAVAANVVAVV